MEVTSSLGEIDERPLRRAVEGKVASLLDALDFIVVPQSPTHLTIAVGWQDDAHTTYASTVALTRDADVVAVQRRTCELCGTNELFEGIASAVADVVRAAPQAPDTETVAATIRSASDDPPREVEATRPPWPCSPLAWSGLAMIGGGGIAIGAGAGLWARGEAVRPGPLGAVAEANPRRIGIGVTAAGATLLLTGTVIAVVSARRRPRRRMIFAPRAGPQAVGVTIAGRF